MVNYTTRKEVDFSETSELFYQTSLRHITQNSLHKHRYENLQCYGVGFCYLNSYWIFKEKYLLSGVDKFFENREATSNFKSLEG
jgi:hypothetical protein